MTSVSRRLSSGMVLATLATLQAGTSTAFGQQPVYVSPSPFGNTSRLAGANFGNSGLSSVGFQNTGFRNAGFQNVGFRNYAPSVTGVRYPGGVSNFSYAPGGYTAPLTGIANQGITPAMNNTAYGPVSQQLQYGQGVNPAYSLGIQAPAFAPDDTATITIGPGTTLNSGMSTQPTLSRGARYTLGLGFDSPVGVTNPRLSEELQRQFTNSTRFGVNNNIKVAVENNVVVLRGKVADDHERDLAEVLVRLSPGVYDVRNDLQVEGSVASANR